MATPREGNVVMPVEQVVQLTVTEDYGQRQEIKKGTVSPCYTLTKVLVMIIVCLALLVCLVASKITVIVISQDLTEGNGTERQFQTQLDADRRLSMLMLLLILLVPYVVTFLWCLWSSGVLFTMASRLCCWYSAPYFEKQNTEGGCKPWPNGCSIFIGCGASVLEVVGLWILVNAVYTHVTGFTSVLIGTFTFTAYNAWNICCSPNPESTGNSRGCCCSPNPESAGNICGCCCSKRTFARILAGIGFSLNLIGVVAIIVYAYVGKPNTLFGQLGTLSLVIVAYVVCFSLAWFPGILRCQLKASTCCRTTNDANSMVNSTRWKAGLLTSMEKIVLTPIILYLFGFYYSHDDAFIRAVYENQGWAWVTGLREHRLFWYFITNVLTSFSAYVLMWVATVLDECDSCKVFISWVFFPMACASPVSAFVLGVYPACNALLPDYQCDHLGIETSVLNISVLVGIWIANFISVGVWLATNKTLRISKETRLFWLPTYNGILTEQWLWLNRRTEKNDPDHRSTFEQRKECHIYICTTMYNESEEEMRQLLTSIKNVVDKRDENSPRYHSHIWLDGAFDTKRKKSKHLNANALRLLVLMKSVFGNNSFEKHDTPYGLQLVWTIKSSKQNGSTMNVVLHFKDNQKVKKKKRWSQIMYLSYIIDFLSKKSIDESVSTEGGGSRNRTRADWEKDLKRTFILATDADVKFTLDSVEALFDVFLRDDDHSVSAVCGRTHPLGSQVLPLVSYQVFDYAIGHWLQKVANHVLGSVLCAPGCFSMYRTSFLKDTIAEYSSDTKSGFEFLYKDMGEDRWLCSLLIKNKSRLEYCAVAEDKTFCPETFDEFFKQRRRWIVSTMANMWMLLRSAKDLVTSSESITYPFMAYQFFLYVSSLIGPATVILVLSGGLEYAFGISDIAISIVLVVVAILFLLICLYTSNETQINVAIGASAIFALVMAAAFIGTIRQLVQEFSTFNLPAVSNSSHTSVTEMPIPVSSVYICAITGTFVITALLHPTEITCLFHGITYLFFLPAGYLFLTIYSICNITDQSWGTREAKTAGQDKGSLQKLWDRVQRTCCPTQEFTPGVGNLELSTDLLDEENDTAREHLINPHDGEIENDATEDITHDQRDEAIPVQNWLSATFYQNEIKAFGDNFKKHGYDDTSFIAGMTKEEIRQVGIINEEQVNQVHAEVQKLPAFEIHPMLPTGVKAQERWIHSIGLVEYKKDLLQHFDDLPNTTEKDQLRMKSGIRKLGHLKRLYQSIQQLRPPTPDEENLKKVRENLKDSTSSSPSIEVNREMQFWEQLIAARLKPAALFKEKEDALKNELIDLRKAALMWFAVANTLWLTVFLTFSNLGTDPSKPDLQLFGNNPLGIVILFIFCFLLIVQFLTMLCHRLLTFIHLLARVPLCNRNVDDISRENNRACCCRRNVDDISRENNRACCCRRAGRSESLQNFAV